MQQTLVPLKQAKIVRQNIIKLLLINLFHILLSALRLSFSLYISLTFFLERLHHKLFLGLWLISNICIFLFQLYKIIKILKYSRLKSISNQIRIINQKRAIKKPNPNLKNPNPEPQQIANPNPNPNPENQESNPDPNPEHNPNIKVIIPPLQKRYLKENSFSNLMKYQYHFFRRLYMNPQIKQDGLTTTFNIVSCLMTLYYIFGIYLLYVYMNSSQLNKYDDNFTGFKHIIADNFAVYYSLMFGTQMLFSSLILTTLIFLILFSFLYCLFLVPCFDTYFSRKSPNNRPKITTFQQETIPKDQEKEKKEENNTNSNNNNDNNNNDSQIMAIPSSPRTQAIPVFMPALRRSSSASTNASETQEVYLQVDHIKEPRVFPEMKIFNQPKFKPHLQQYQQYQFDEESNSNSGPQCAICLESFQQDQKLVQLPCHKSHIFHTNCLKNWLKLQKKCPICRKKYYNYILQQIEHLEQKCWIYSDCYYVFFQCQIENMEKLTNIFSKVFMALFYLIQAFL